MAKTRSQMSKNGDPGAAAGIVSAAIDGPVKIEGRPSDQ
jgi:hypothetical protein